MIRTFFLVKFLRFKTVPNTMKMIISVSKTISGFRKENEIMKLACVVFQNQYDKLKKENGMIVFFLICLLLFGVLVPILIPSRQSILTMIIFFDDADQTNAC